MISKEKVQKIRANLKKESDAPVCAAQPSASAIQALALVCNYVPHVLSASRRGEDVSPRNILVRFELQVGPERTGPFTYTLQELRTLDFEQLDYRCQNFSGRKGERAQLLFRCIQEQVRQFDLTGKTYFEKSGWTVLDGKHYFVAGDQLIGQNKFFPVQNFAVSSDLQQLHLKVDQHLTSKAVLEAMQAVFNSNETVSTCAALYFFYSMLQPLYREAGWDHSFVCYLFGPSQSRKTTFTRLLTSIFCADTQAPQPADISLLSTSPAIAEELERFPGICRLVDDLYVGSSRAEARKREEKISEVIRLLGNHTVRQKMDGQSHVAKGVDCGVFCTAEYLPQGYSTLVRCLLLQVEDPFDSAFLSYIQRRPLAWPTFCFRFLSWCACHYDTIVKRLSKMRNSFERQRGENPLPEERLKEMEFSLTSALKILMLFLKENMPDCSRNKYHNAEQMCQSRIRACLESQANLLKRAKPAQRGDQFPSALAEMYLDGTIVTTDSPKKKFKEGEAAVLRYGYLWMRPQYLVSLLRRYFSDSTITFRQVTPELRASGLLCMDGSRDSTKKLAKCRAVCIYLEHLLDLFGPPDISAGCLLEPWSDREQNYILF